MINKQYKITIPFSLEYSEDSEGNAYDPLTDRELSTLMRSAQQAVVDNARLFNKYLTFRVAKIEEILNDL